MWVRNEHYSDVIMSATASQKTDASIVDATVCSGADQSKHQSSASLAFVWRIHRWPVNSPYKGPVTRKMFPFDHVIMHKRRGCWYWGFMCLRILYSHCIAYFNGLVQDSSNSSVLALELLQSCTKASICNEEGFGFLMKDSTYLYHPNVTEW